MGHCNRPRTREFVPREDYIRNRRDRYQGKLAL